MVTVIDDWDGIAIASPSIERLRKIADVEVLGECEEQELVERIAAAVAIIPIRERRLIGPDLLAQLPQLRHIAQTGGGIAHIDSQAAAERGITISMTPGASASSVSELVFGLMIASRRGLVRSVASLRAGVWDRPLGFQLAGTTLGVVGYGATGCAVAEGARALGMRVVVNSRRAQGGRIDGFEALDLDELCEQADAVSLHVELSTDTTGIITRTQLRKIGARGLLINTARADLVVRDDLLAALESGELGGAALDVLNQEPPLSDDAIVAHPAVIATPHLGWRTGAVMEAYLESAVDNVVSWIEREKTKEEVVAR